MTSAKESRKRRARLAQQRATNSPGGEAGLLAGKSLEKAALLLREARLENQRLGLAAEASATALGAQGRLLEEMSRENTDLRRQLELARSPSALSATFTDAAGTSGTEATAQSSSRRPFFIFIDKTAGSPPAAAVEGAFDLSRLGVNTQIVLWGGEVLPSSAAMSDVRDISYYGDKTATETSFEHVVKFMENCAKRKLPANIAIVLDGDLPEDRSFLPRIREVLAKNPAISLDIVATGDGMYTAERLVRLLRKTPSDKVSFRAYETTSALVEIARERSFLAKARTAPPQDRPKGATTVGLRA
jgi:hypothetical protein